MRVQLLSFPGCPNAEVARRNLLEAFRRVGLRPAWEDVNLDDEATPASLRGYGSPAVLVKGKDVSGKEPDGAGISCRLYLGTSGAPSVEAIARSLRSAAARGAVRSGRLLSLGALPGVGAALLPVGACPACWPAYASGLSSLGVAFLSDSSVLFPVTAALVLLAVGSLAWRARQCRGFGPFALGLGAAVLLLVGKFALESSLLTYGAIALFLAASVWNAWPLRSASETHPCPACSAPGAS